MADVQNFSGFITPVASSTAKCGLVITPGAEPSVPEPGGVWYDIGDDAFALFSVDGTVTYLPKGNGLTGQIVRSNGTTSVPTFQTLLLSKGAWSGGTAYIANDIVTDTGSAYICILAHTNHQPPNGTYWNLLVANGVSGGVNFQSGATYTIQASDNGKMVIMTNAGSLVTIPAGLPANFVFWLNNQGAAPATLAPTGKTINGATSVNFATVQAAAVFMDSSGNYWTADGRGTGIP